MMKDIFFTILVIWVLWKIFGGRSFFSMGSNRESDGKHNSSSQREGETTIITGRRSGNSQSSKDDGDYVDYEEIK